MKKIDKNLCLTIKVYGDSRTELLNELTEFRNEINCNITVFHNEKGSYKDLHTFEIMDLRRVK